MERFNQIFITNSIGNPENEKVRMGSLAGQSQRKEVKGQVQKLLASSQIIYGSLDSVEVIDADAKKGAFISPVLLKNENPFTSDEVHNVEAFGPVSTIMPYKNMDEAIQLAKMGKGSLCSTVVTANEQIAKNFMLGSGTYHGRILVLNRDCCKRKYGSWFTLADAYSWRTRTRRWWRRNGRIARRKTLYATGGITGFSNYAYGHHKCVPAKRKRKCKYEFIHLKNILKNWKSAIS